MTPYYTYNKSEVRGILILLICSAFTTYVNGQKLFNKIPFGPRFSTEAERCNCPCLDTIKVFYTNSVADISKAFPSWLPVIGFDEISELEGIVTPKPTKLEKDHVHNHVSPEDLPINHYTHDMTFDVIPDVTPDNRYTNLLSLLVHQQSLDSIEIHDTTLREYIHVEWESGLGANNPGNICAELNRKGESCGFFSEGHQRGDVIWNWPTVGDWVHVEGVWIWDRGHPPAGTEIHPARLVAIRRNLPQLVSISNEKKQLDKKVYATRIDIFASGDGGALYNNRKGTPDFVSNVRMSDKNYSFDVRMLTNALNNNTPIGFAVKTQKGHTYPGDAIINLSKKSDGVINITIPWKNKSDTLVFAQTIYAYWDENEYDLASYNISSYKVQIEKIKFRNRKDVNSRAELRVFTEVGGDWIFLNELVTEKEDILNSGLGKTYKKSWAIDKSFYVHVPIDKFFRVHAGGWEADGTNEIFGHLMHPYSPCDEYTKEMFHNRFFNLFPVVYGGCMDDFIGEVHDYYSHRELSVDVMNFTSKSDGITVFDPCPLNNGKQEDIFRLFYTITKIDDINSIPVIEIR